MIMADVLMWFFIVVGVLLVLNSYWLLAQALFPALVTRAREAYGYPVRITVLGLVLVLPLVALGGLVLGRAANPGLRLAGVLVLALPVVLGLIGSAGLSQRIGAGLGSPGDEARPWRAVLRGGVVLSGTFLLPIAGWFVLLPWALVSGCGAAVRSMFRARRDAASERLRSAEQAAG